MKLTIINILLLFLTSCQNVYPKFSNQNPSYGIKDKEEPLVKTIITKKNGNIISIKEFNQSKKEIYNLDFRHNNSIEFSMIPEDSTYKYKQIVGYIDSNKFYLSVVYSEKIVNQVSKIYVVNFNRKNENRSEIELLNCYKNYLTKIEFEKDSAVIKLLEQTDKKLLVEKKYDSLEYNYEEIWYNEKTKDTSEIHKWKDGLTIRKDEFEVRKYVYGKNSKLSETNTYLFSNDKKIKSEISEISGANEKVERKITLDYIDKIYSENRWEYKKGKLSMYYECNYLTEDEYLKKIQYKYNGNELVREIKYDNINKTISTKKYIYEKGKLSKEIISIEYLYKRMKDFEEINYQYVYF